MAAYELLGYKWGDAALGSAGGQVTWSLANTVGAFFDFDYQIAEKVYQALIRDAFAAWEAVANIDFVEVADSSTVDLRLGWDAIDGPGGTLGEAQSSYIVESYGVATQSEIRFDVTDSWSTSPTSVGTLPNFYAVALHEIGHSIGLGHTDDPSTVMYPYATQVINLSPGDIEGAVLLYGSAGSASPGNDHYVGTAGNDTYNGMMGDDTIESLAGNDVLTGGPGADYIDGGSGLDIAVFSGSRAEYSIDRGAGTQIKLLDSFAGSASDGFDTLLNVERLSFTDGTLAFDLEGNAGQAYRLYQAAFDRIPDVGGLGYWIDQADNGMSLRTIASNFIGSAEFRSLYGSDTSETEFVNLLYQNVLNRSADPVGYQYWTGRLGADLTGADVLAAFSESSENKGNVQAAIDDGIWYV